MKKILILSALLISSVAGAQTHTISAGYSQGQLKHFDDLKGANIKYRYEINPAVGVVASFNYLGKKQEKESGSAQSSFRVDSSTDAKYYSLTVGPSFRVNDFVSLYGTVGVGIANIDGHDKYYSVDSSGNSTPLTEARVESRQPAVAYGLGMQINPQKNWAIDVAYERSEVDMVFEKQPVNIFNVGVGYRF